MPPITYPAELPVSQRKDEIAQAIRDHQVVVIAGETGSGKTTQIPKICLELGRGVDGQIGHTQPRRLAARTVAERIAEELGSPARRGGRLPGPVHRRVGPRHAGEADDRRHLAERARPRPGPAPLRHADHRRGARAQPEHRLHPRLPPAAAAPPPGPEGDHHLGDHRPGAVRGRLRRRAHRRGVRPDLPGGDALPAAGRGGATRARRSATRSTSCPPRAPATSWSSCPGSARSGTPPTCWPAGTGSTSCRCTRGCPPPSSTGSSSAARPPASPAGSCWPPTWPRPRSPCPASSTSSTRAPPASPGTATGTKVQRLPIEPISQASANQRKGRCGRTSDGICIRLYSRGGLRVPAGVHRPRDPAHQPGLGHLADGGDRPRRRPEVPVHRPARRAEHRRRPRPCSPS